MENPQELTLKQRLQKDLGLKESDFDTHASDLHVKYSDAVNNWLMKNYEFYHSIEKFFDARDRKTLWLDIPFGYMTEDFTRRHGKK